MRLHIIKQLTRDDLQHFKHIEEAIDGLLFRTSMNNEENKDMIQSLLQLGFSKDKIIIHSDTTLLEELNLKRIHFKSNDTTAFAYKAAHPDIYVSMSTHDVETVKRCYENNLDYVFWGTFFQPLHIQIRHHVLKDHSTSIRCSYPYLCYWRYQ